MDYIASETLGFNKAPPFTMMVDINSCFATIEQQANPLLRHKPVVVGAFTTNRGCILAASREAKKLGIKTGMMVGEARAIYPRVIVLPSDPDKYRFVHKQLVKLLSLYSDNVCVKSIDEMVFSLERMPALLDLMQKGRTIEQGMQEVALEIKQKIKTQIGEWITVSIGIAPNRYLAKIAAGHRKPDGLTLITAENAESLLFDYPLEDLTGIKEGMKRRLATQGIYTTKAFYGATIKRLRLAFASIIGYHWWLRLHGFEADDREFSRKTIGQQHALARPLYPQDEALLPIVYQLVAKMGLRLRTDGYVAGGVSVGCFFGNHQSWGVRKKQHQVLYDDRDLYKKIVELLKAQAPHELIRVVGVSCFDLGDSRYIQQCLFDDREKKENLVKAHDAVIARFGDGVIIPARVLMSKQRIKDRISFGSVPSIDYSMKGIQI